MYNAIIVDDEPRAVWALEENIDWRKCGIRRVYTASNIKNAIKMIQETKIEVLICDIEMPNGYGTSLLEWLRDQRINMSCIFVTCHQEYDIMRKAIQLQCYDYILKPIDYDAFTQLLMEMVEKMESWENESRKSGHGHWGEWIAGDIIQKNEESTRNIELEVKRYIKEHLADNILSADIAQALHFNPNYLMRAFILAAIRRWSKSTQSLSLGKISSVVPPSPTGTV